MTISDPDPNTDPPAPHEQTGARVGQTQSAGINLGAYNMIQQLGDLVAGHQITIVVYTGPAQPLDEAAHFSLEQAYRSEVAARYAAWCMRYAPLPMYAQVAQDGDKQPRPFLAPEDFMFEALVAPVSSTAQATEDNTQATPAPTRLHTFTDLREGLRQYHHLLLLGPPGGGKTTALWRLALDLAQDGLRVDGDRMMPLPIFIHLGGVRPGDSLDALVRRSLSQATLYDRSKNPVRLSAHQQMAALLPDLLHAGRVVLLWDGLNETPTSLFDATAKAIHSFCSKYPPSFSLQYTSVTTCRAADFARLQEKNNDLLPIQHVTVQGLESATIRELVTSRLGPEDGHQLLGMLEQPQDRALLALARTPLLLTMLCEVYARLRQLPSNRSKLIEAFVRTRWDWEHQRNSDQWISWVRQQKVLAQLAYAITASHGRGTSVSWDWARRIMAQADGIIDVLQLRNLAHSADILEILDTGDAIRFSHQLIQEYFAAVALEAELTYLAQPHLRVTRRWQHEQSFWQKKLNQYLAPGRRTGWEETLFLLAGLHEHVRYLPEFSAIIRSHPLEAAQVLAAGDSNAVLQNEVKAAAMQQLADSQVTVQQRLDAGRALGLLGDPRFPVTIAEWRAKLERRNTQFGAPNGYFCCIRPGTYRIGGWEPGQSSADIALPAFWIARLPITVAQFTPFVDQGYGSEAERWWTPNGWRWKQQWKRDQPWEWNNPAYTQLNQPVIGVTWYEARAFCAWLNEQLTTTLAEGYVLRLPTEAEWEAAAAYHANMKRRMYPWGETPPTPEYAIYNVSQLKAPAPVGCCPVGVAACGALDMAGNVWEVTTSSSRGYPNHSVEEKKDFTTDEVDVAWRGGSWFDNSISICCGGRFKYHPDGWDDNSGFRLVVAPQSPSGLEGGATEALRGNH